MVRSAYFVLLVGSRVFCFFAVHKRDGIDHRHRWKHVELWERDGYIFSGSSDFLRMGRRPDTESGKRNDERIGDVYDQPAGQ